MPEATPSSVTIRLPQLTFKAPYPLPYAALTTVFTPPGDCPDRWTLISGDTDPKTTSIGNFVNLLDTNDATCLPPGYGRDIWSATFSPGVYCPSGYAIAATGTEVIPASWEVDVPSPSDQRKLVCCLRWVQTDIIFFYSFFSFRADNSGAHSGFNYQKLGTADACISSYDHSTDVFTKDYVTTSNQFVYTQKTQVGGGIAIGHPIHLRHNDQEFHAYFTGIPSNADSGSKGAGLSSATIAGIAVGVGAVGLGALAFATWFILRHRKRKQQQQPPSQASSVREEEEQETPAAPRHPAIPPEWAAKEPKVSEKGRSKSKRPRHHSRSRTK